MLFCGEPIDPWSMVFNVSWSIDPSPPATHRRAAPKRCPWWRVHQHSGASRVIMIPTKPAIPGGVFAQRWSKLGGKVRSSSSSQRFCSWTCGCLLLKRPNFDEPLGDFRQHLCPLLHKRTTCGKRILHIFSANPISPAKMEKLRFVYGCKHWKKHGLLWCQEQWKTALSPAVPAKTDHPTNPHEMMAFEHKAAGFFVEDFGQILWAAIAHTPAAIGPLSSMIKIDLPIHSHEFIVTKYLWLLIGTKLVSPKTVKKYGHPIANGEHLDRPASVTKNCPRNNTRWCKCERVDSTSRDGRLIKFHEISKPPSLSWGAWDQLPNWLTNIAPENSSIEIPEPVTSFHMVDLAKFTEFPCLPCRVMDYRYHPPWYCQSAVIKGCLIHILDSVSSSVIASVIYPGYIADVNRIPYIKFSENSPQSIAVLNAQFVAVSHILDEFIVKNPAIMFPLMLTNELYIY